MKIAIATDSNSGITQEQSAEEGIFVIPMPFMIDGVTYLEGINLSQREFYDRQAADADISTSQPSPQDVINFWDKLLEDHDQVVYIPMSSGLSGSCQTAVMLAQDYEGKVEVVNNQRISVTQRQSARDALKMAQQGMDAAQIKKVLEDTKFESSIYITVDTLKFLKKGGRITPAAAALGTLLKLKPVLTIQGEKLDAFAKARTMKQAKSMMITAISHDLEQRFNDKECENTWLQIAHTDSEEAAREFEKELRELFPKANIYLDSLSLSISCHIGPGALAVACSKKIV
ncbi:DegV family EDD domain-containing protein [Clostridium sp. MCC353]|uniref:DegV family protein n=1 Tax=Clostridium sp. MCC353 TaxID=2592646 RepID=UPI001C019380|nr:DegV family protein [Clostridium sp. MCC353]MBT9779090.1 DegV family EDD domain-containing protein [Clostridium sp. MCC353]